MKTVLLVEDDPKLREGLCLALQSDEFCPLPCGTLAEARQALLQTTVDLLLLDIHLPDGSGLDLLRESKRVGGPPVILLTANDTEMDIVLGLESGADDYIAKPFSLAILRARVKAQLRSAKEGAAGPVKTDGYCFDFDHMAFSHAGTAVELSKTEQKLLRLLVENPGAILPRETLLQRIWGSGADFVDENTLSVAVNRLRGKLNAQNRIKTVYGIGYTWVVD